MFITPPAAKSKASIETGMQGVCNADSMQNSFRLIYIYIYIYTYIHTYIHTCIHTYIIRVDVVRWGRSRPEDQSKVRSISEMSSCFFGPRPWHIEIRHRIKKTSTTNLFGFETLRLSPGKPKQSVSWV